MVSMGLSLHLITHYTDRPKSGDQGDERSNERLPLKDPIVYPYQDLTY